jgi:general secretion pathway protein K
MSIVRNERGMVLLLVLLVVALLATILTELSFSTLVDMRLAETFRDTTRASYLSRGGLKVGQALLKDDNNNYDATDEMWALGVQQYPVAEGAVSIEIIDLGGRIDLNQLYNEAFDGPDSVIKPRYRLLLQQLEILEADRLIDTLVDWLDPDGPLEPQGAENSAYISRAEPIQCKNGPLDTVEELLLVEGYTPEILEKLRPHVTAYGGGKIINVNTASREVLMSLSEELDTTAVDSILEAREKNPFTLITQVRDLPEMESLYGFISLYIDVKSQRYQVTSTGQVNDGRAVLQAAVAKDTHKILFQRML